MAESAAEQDVVAQIVRDVARAWTGRAFVLELTGRVEGSWQIGTGDVAGQNVRFDAVELCRALSGRGEPEPPPGPGAASELRDEVLALRILF